MIARSTVLRRGFGLAVAAVLATSGCAAGRDSQTSNQVPTQDGTNANVGTMALRGIALRAPTTGAFWKPGSAIAMRLVLVNNGTSDDRLTNITGSVTRGWASFRNTSEADQAAEALTSTPAPSTSAAPSPSDTTPSDTTPSDTTPPDTDTAPPASSTTTTSTSSAPKGVTSVVVPAGQRVSWGVPDSQRVLLLLPSAGRIYPGTTVKITFTFARAGSVSVAVPVQVSDDPSENTIAPISSSD